MKKLLLPLFTVLTALTLRAEEFTFNVTTDATDIVGTYVEEKSTEAAKYQPLQSLKLGNFAFAFEKGTASTDAAYYYPMSTNENGKSTIRLYKNGNQVTITAPEGVQICKVTFTGTGSSTVKALYEGVGQNSVTYTTSETAIRMETVTITTGEGSEPEPQPEVTYAEYKKSTTAEAGSFVLIVGNKVANGVLGTKEPHSYGYLQVDGVTVNNDAAVVNKAYAFTFTAVEGGYTIQDSESMYYYGDANYNSISRAAEMPEAGALWTMVANEDGTMKITNVLTEKYLQLDSQYGTFGIYNDVKGDMPYIFKYVKDVEDAPSIPSVATLKEIYDLSDKANITVNLDLTVAYANGSYVYVTDGTDYALIYKKDLNLEAGNVIGKGWEAKVSIYHGLYELVPTAATLATTGNAAAMPQPAEVEEDTASTMLVAANQNYYVALMEVTFAEATPAADATSETLEDGTKVDHREFTGKMGEYEVSFYQRFGVESVEAGTYDVIGFISVYDSKVQIQPIRFATPGGVAGIAADNAEAIYFTLDGVRVANPAAGHIYIRVQGAKASKVIF